MSEVWSGGQQTDVDMAIMADIDNMFAVSQEQKNTAAETVNDLEAYFGSQKFKYGQHAGTFSDMVATCTAVQDIMSQGYDSAKSMLEHYEISEEEYQEYTQAKDPTDEQGDDEETTNDEPDKAHELEKTTDTHEAPDQPDTGNREARADEQSPLLVQHAPPLAPALEREELHTDDSEAEKLDSSPLPAVPDPVLVPKAEILVAQASSDAGVDGEPVASGAPPATADNELSASPRTEQPPERSTGDSYLAGDGEETATVNDASPPSRHHYHYQPAAVDTHETSTFDTYTELPEYISREKADELAEQPVVSDAFQIPNEHLLAEMPAWHDTEESPHETAEMLDVREETEAGVLFVPEATHTNAADDLEEAPVEIAWEPEPHHASAEIHVPTVLQQVVEREHATDTAEKSDEEREESDEPAAETVAEAMAEIITVFTGEEPMYEPEALPESYMTKTEQVVQAIEQLETAQTQGECAEYLEELQASLTALFDALGFEAAADMAERLVRQYDTKTLKQFIVTLLRTVKKNESARAATPKRQHRRHWFGKRVVERVVATLPV